VHRLQYECNWGSLRSARSPRGGLGRQEPGSVRVLLSNPRWERRLLRFLELSGVGRIVEDGSDVEEARADRNCVGSRGEGRAGAPNLISFPFPFCTCSGGLIPRALRIVRAGGEGSHLLSLCCSNGRGLELVSFVQAVMYGGSTYPLGMIGPHQKREPNKINKSLRSGSQAARTCHDCPSPACENCSP